MNSPTNLSNNLAVVFGAGQSTFFSSHNFSKNCLHSSLSKFSGIFTFNSSSNPLIKDILLNGGLKSISNTFFFSFFSSCC